MSLCAAGSAALAVREAIDVNSPHFRAAREAANMAQEAVYLQAVADIPAGDDDKEAQKVQEAEREQQARWLMKVLFSTEEEESALLRPEPSS